MKITKSKKLFLIFISISYGLFFQFQDTTKAGCPDMIRHWENELKKEGFSIETKEGLIKATKDRAYIRGIALSVLTARFPNESAPVLKEALNDESLLNRIEAAHLLGTLGDKSGLEQMQKDFTILLPRNGEEKPEDPNIAKDPEALENWEKNKRWRISKGLEVALVLAELGDYRGYNLASRQVKEGAYAAIRYRATDVLAQIAQLDDDILKSKMMDPVGALSAAVKDEEERTAYIAIVMAAEKIKSKKGEKILEAAEKNTKMADFDIRRVKSSLNRIKKEISMIEKEAEKSEKN